MTISGSRGKAVFGKEVAAVEWNDWKWQFRNRIRSLKQLAKLQGCPVSHLASCEPVLRTYPVAITPYYLSLFDSTDENDPLRRQCFPDPREVTFSLGGIPDPLAEERFMPFPGLIRRYPDRCLAMVTGTCALYCRHCNRKRLWLTGKSGTGWGKLKRMVDFVARTPALREVIVSGGDPLMIPEPLLDRFLGALREIPHLEVLRIGSRVPVTMPMRITPELCAMLKRHRPLWFNTQFNHAREITEESARACEMLLTAGIPVGNQSVLLKGVNDDYESMRDLLYGLERISVRPYYLFQCDPVRGTDHFRADIRTGMEIMDRLWHNVSGLCIPRYVLDCPGGYGKVPLQTYSLSLKKQGTKNIFLTMQDKWTKKYNKICGPDFKIRDRKRGVSIGRRNSKRGEKNHVHSQ
ncbi:MAG: KamA family radical SAM protein [Syntrophales bacterium]|nr:KamA family radical SAM protein [Syntrophales bacterium]